MQYYSSISMYFQASKYSPRHNLLDIGLVFCVGAHNINKLEFLRESWSQNLFLILFILEDPFEVLQTSFVVPLIILFYPRRVMVGLLWVKNVKGDTKSIVNTREYVMKEVSQYSQRNLLL